MPETPTPAEIAELLKKARAKVDARIQVLNQEAATNVPRPNNQRPPQNNNTNLPVRGNSNSGPRPMPVRPTVDIFNPIEYQKRINEARNYIKQISNKNALDAKQAQEPKITGGLKSEIHPMLRQNVGKIDKDSIGNFISRSNFTTAKANQKMFRPVIKENKAPPKEVDITQLPTYDPDLGKEYIAPKPRFNRTLKFNEPGKYIEKAAQLKSQEMMEQLKKDIEERAKTVGMEDELELVTDKVLKKEPPPAAEWWDRRFFPPQRHGQELEFDYSKVTFEVDNGVDRYVQHPVSILNQRNKDIVKPLMLTKKEHKKLRRQRRAEELKEKREKIRLGLLPPEETKVKASNVMRVLGNEAVMDPTQIDVQVRKVVAQRKRAHEQQNLDRKLTKEELREKNRRKNAEAIRMHGIHSLIFKVGYLNRQQEYKVDVNAGQMQLSGVAIIYRDFTFIVVEGSQKYTNDYKKLMLRRIQWNSDSIVPDDEMAVGAALQPNYCSLVWEGKIPSRLFRGFKVHRCPTANLARQTLARNNADHLWDHVRSIKDEYVAIEPKNL